MHGRGRSEQGIAISVTSEFQTGLGNVSPDTAQLSLFSLVYRRRGTFIGKSLLDLPADMGNDVRGEKNVSFNYVSAGDQHLFALLAGGNLFTGLNRRKLINVGGK